MVDPGAAGVFWDFMAMLYHKPLVSDVQNCTRSAIQMLNSLNRGWPFEDIAEPRPHAEEPIGRRAQAAEIETVDYLEVLYDRSLIREVRNCARSPKKVGRSGGAPLNLALIRWAGRVTCPRTSGILGDLLKILRNLPAIHAVRIRARLPQVSRDFSRARSLVAIELFALNGLGASDRNRRNQATVGIPPAFSFYARATGDGRFRLRFL